MKELTIEATPENVDRAIEFVDEMLAEYGCRMKEQMAIDVAVDELFANIAHYAYNPETGYATVQVDVIQEPMSVEITFVDNGKPYDPLAKVDPDTTQSIENREIGGMGILIVKKAWMPWIINIRTARIFLLSRKTLVQNHVTDFLEYSFILTRSV